LAVKIEKNSITEGKRKCSTFYSNKVSEVQQTLASPITVNPDVEYSGSKYEKMEISVRSPSAGFKKDVGFRNKRD
jgi:hypothetical protein